MFAFSLGIDTISWIYINDILPDKGISIVSTIMWAFSAAIVFMFPLLAHSFLKLQGLIFIFSILCFGSALFIYKKIPETKDKSMLEVR